MQVGAGGSGWQLFSDWSSIRHIAAQAALFYVIMVVALRVAGQRALAKMSAYDMIVTVALGGRLVRQVRNLPERCVSRGLGGGEPFLGRLQLLLDLLQALELLRGGLAVELLLRPQLVDARHERAPFLVGAQ